jgi:glycosyltransferase involved in cell wall biosynthesis
MISGILITWNDLLGLKAWADSYKGQVSFCSEIFIVDGGSTDGSYEYILTLPKNWNIKWVKAQNGNRGNSISPISECRNLGIRLANYDKLVFFDTGCHYPKDYVSLVSDKLNCAEIIAVWNQAVTNDEFTTVYNELFMPKKHEFTSGFIASSRGIGMLKSALISNNCFYPTKFYWSGEDTYFFKQVVDCKLKIDYNTDICVLWDGPKNIDELRDKHTNYAKGRVLHGILSVSKSFLRLIAVIPLFVLGLLSLRFRMKSVVNWVNLVQDIVFIFRRYG